jgi:hypothetical protein
MNETLKRFDRVHARLVAAEMAFELGRYADAAAEMRNAEIAVEQLREEIQ